jgi:ferredoxin-NADP reductase
MTAHNLMLRVQMIGWETEAVRVFELRDPNGAALPPFEPGAHVDLTLPGNFKRSYSLIGSAEDCRRYEIGVYREPASRGGSVALHDRVRVGDLLEVSEPSNDFPLADDGAHTVLIAGGIGITPFLPMIERLLRQHRSFELYYSARDRRAAAFLDRVSACGDRLRLNLTREPEGRRLDLHKIVDSLPLHSHLYCCGPHSMIDDFEAATADLPSSRVHIERFTAAAPAAVDGGYLIELARTGRTLAVPPGKTILQTLLDDGIDVPCSCMEGVCGTCETRVLAGLPEHRDGVLSREEREAGNTMMICCSGAKSERLVLDL